MQFPTFDGNHPKIWHDNYNNYFTIYKIEDDLKVTAATMHLQENAAKWWQAYKHAQHYLHGMFFAQWYYLSLAQMIFEQPSMIC
jgi:hypothetical protein